jgi:hypothetical protein
MGIHKNENCPLLMRMFLQTANSRYRKTIFLNYFRHAKLLTKLIGNIVGLFDIRLNSSIIIPISSLYTNIAITSDVAR